MKTITLTDAEYEALHGILARALDDAGNAGCNDYPIRDTPENRKMLLAVDKFAEPDEVAKDDWTHDSAGNLVTNDLTLIDFLCSRLGFYDFECTCTDNHTCEGHRA